MMQLHAWGRDLGSALEHIVPCMFNYMTDIATVEVRETEGRDLRPGLAHIVDCYPCALMTPSGSASQWEGSVAS